MLKFDFCFIPDYFSRIYSPNSNQDENLGRKLLTPKDPNKTYYSSPVQK